VGRPKKKGIRIGKRLSRAITALVDRNPPSPHILERRALFSFVTATKGGNIDQDICDGIGQLHALGLLDTAEIDPLALRDAGREFAELWWTRYSATAPKMGAYERADKSSNPHAGETSKDRRFDRMDEALTGYERDVVTSLVVDLAWGDEVVPWAKSLIDEALLKHGKLVKFTIFPTSDDRARLDALIRGLTMLAGGALSRRRAA